MGMADFAGGLVVLGQLEPRGLESSSDLERGAEEGTNREHSGTVQTETADG